MVCWVRPLLREKAVSGKCRGHLDYDKLYREAMIKGDVKPAKETIDKALPKIQDAYKKGYEMLKNVGQFNPDRFRQYIKSPLDLSHVKQFIREFVSHHSERFTPFGELIDFQTPKFLISAKVKRKYHAITFDREIAMNESVMTLEFMAMGHPFTDAAIKYAGGAEMGGFTATRQIMDYRFSGAEGIHFNFMVKRKEKTDDREEIVFDLVPIFLAWDGALVEGAGEAALEAWGTKAIPEKKLVFYKDKVKDLIEAASAKVREKYQNEEFWPDDIVCLNAAVTRFV